MSICKFLIELEVMWVALIAYKPDLILVVDHLLIILIQSGVNMEYNDKDLVEQLAFVDLLLGQEVLFPHHHQPRKFDFSKISLVIAEYHQQVHQYHVKKQKFTFPSISCCLPECLVAYMSHNHAVSVCLNLNLW